MLRGGKGKARGSAGRVGSNISVQTMSSAVTRPKLPTLLHEIKALQQITYLKLAWSFINVNPTKNAFFLTLINVTSA